MFLDSLVSVLWGGDLGEKIQKETPKAITLPLQELPSDMEPPPSLPTIETHKHPARISGELPPLKKTKRNIEPLEEDKTLDKIEASLSIFPFTLQNMAKKFVQDMSWRLELEGVIWTFYVHVLSSDREENSAALVGLKVKGSQCTQSGTQTPEEQAEQAPQQTSSGSLLSLTQSHHGSPASNFEVSWKVISQADESVLASSAPAEHSVEPGDSYIVEYVDEEFDFTSTLNHGLRIVVLVRKLGEENEENEIFYDSEEDEHDTGEGHSRDHSLSD